MVATQFENATVAGKDIALDSLTMTELAVAKADQGSSEVPGTLHAAAPVSSWLSATRTARAWAPTTSRHPAPPGSSPLPPTSTPAPTTAPWPRRWPRWLSRPGAVLPGADPADPPQVGLLPREPIGDRLANAVRHCSSARPLPIDDSDDPSGTCRWDHHYHLSAVAVQSYSAGRRWQGDRRSAHGEAARPAADPPGRGAGENGAWPREPAWPAWRSRCCSRCRRTRRR